ncbi:MAG: threonine--tRNA ligase, partial [Candidatus Micrarchaeota archaeon]|nr:threonine--tRNA ligase [Candidatus Micrarchaeota archaeon]
EEVVAKAASDIKKHLGEVKAETIVIYPYAHLSSNLAKPGDAVLLLSKLLTAVQEFNPSAIRSPFGWYKTFELKCKGHPLAELSKTINVETLGALKGIKSKGNADIIETLITPAKSVAAVEQAVSESLKQESQLKSEFFILTPDGEVVPYEKFDFKNHANLKKFMNYEVKKVRVYAEEPPHIKLMKEHGLVNYEPASDQGNFRWLPKGLLIKKLLERHVGNLMVNYGAAQVETPIMYDYEHPALKKYLNRFPARQYVVKSDDKEFFLRFSACFGQFLAVHDALITYKNLPFRIYELTHYSFRREQSGELAGLKRLRAFSMPDMHTMCADFKQAQEEFERQYRLCAAWNNDLGIEFETAFRAQTDFFKENKAWYIAMAKHIGKPMLLELFNERYAYFITKFEMNFVDAADKATGMSTVQIDVENSETFDLSYVDDTGKKQRFVILHASIPGAVERVVYALLEREGMKIRDKKTPMLPLWLSPTQVRIIPVSDKVNQRCEEILTSFAEEGFRVDFDDRGETLQKKIRQAEQEWVPFIAVVGEREAADGNLTVRIRETGKQETFTVNQLIEKLERESIGKPKEKLSLSSHLSLRPRF